MGRDVRNALPCHRSRVNAFWGQLEQDLGINHKEAHNGIETGDHKTLFQAIFNYMNIHTTAKTTLYCVLCRVPVDIKSMIGSEHADER